MLGSDVMSRSILHVQTFLHVQEYPSVYKSILCVQAIPPCSGAFLHVPEYPSKPRSISSCPRVSLHVQEHPFMFRSIPPCPGVSLHVQEYPPCLGVSLLVREYPSFPRGSTMGWTPEVVDRRQMYTGHIAFVFLKKNCMHVNDLCRYILCS